MIQLLQCDQQTHTHFVRITMFEYANSYMFWALLAHHQAAHTCIKQSSKLSFIPSVWNCHKLINM